LVIFFSPRTILLPTLHPAALRYAGCHAGLKYLAAAAAMKKLRLFLCFKSFFNPLYWALYRLAYFKINNSCGISAPYLIKWWSI
jgi:hypothetical protein